MGDFLPIPALRVPPMRCGYCFRLLLIPPEQFAAWTPTLPHLRPYCRQPGEESPFYRQWEEGYRPCCSVHCAIQGGLRYATWCALSPEEREAVAALDSLELLDVPAESLCRDSQRLARLGGGPHGRGGAPAAGGRVASHPRRRARPRRVEPDGAVSP